MMPVLRARRGRSQALGQSKGKVQMGETRSAGQPWRESFPGRTEGGVQRGEAPAPALSEVEGAGVRGCPPESISLLGWGGAGLAFSTAKG